MGVRYSVLGGGVARRPTSFSDNFDRANTTSGLGLNWFISAGLVGTGQNFMHVNSNRGRFARAIAPAGTGGNTVFAYPVDFIDNQGLDNRPQFAECVWISNNVAANRGGPTCMMAGDPQSRSASGANTGTTGKCYCLAIDPAAVAVTLVVIDGSNAALYTVQSVLLASVSGDVYRMEVTPGSSGNVILATRNGVSFISVTDSNAGRPTSGVPGLAIRTLAEGAAFVIDNYDGGLLVA